MSTSQLKYTNSSLESALKRLDSMVGNPQKPPHVAKYIKGSTTRSGNSLLETVGASFASSFISDALGGGSSTRPNNVSTQLESDDSGYFNLSNGQMMAMMTSALNKASRRYL